MLSFFFIMALSLGTNALFVQAELVWNNRPNSDVLPDWMSMLYFNAQGLLF